MGEQRHGVKSLWKLWRPAQWGVVAYAGRTQAAEGMLVANFFAPFGDLDVPKGFAKNGDTIADL